MLQKQIISLQWQLCHQAKIRHRNTWQFGKILTCWIRMQPRVKLISKITSHSHIHASQFSDVTLPFMVTYLFRSRNSSLVIISFQQIQTICIVVLVSNTYHLLHHTISISMEVSPTLPTQVASSMQHIKLTWSTERSHMKLKTKKLIEIPIY